MADDQVYGFGKNDADAVIRLIGGNGGEVQQFRHPTSARSAAIALTGASPIAARSGTTVSSGTVTLQSVSGGTLSATSTTVTAYNLWPVAIPATFYITVVQEQQNGLWIAHHPGIINLRLSGTTLQYTIDGTTWTTWHTGTECP